MKVNLIVFDTETNGMRNCSILSIAAIKLVYDFDTNSLKKIDEYYRFYYRKPGENIDYGALKVNGLYDKVIDEKRKNVNYPLYFHEDIESFKTFTGDTKHFIAHNIAFDRTFIPFALPQEFCTMKENIHIIKIPKGSSYKWPKLNELATFYKVPLDNENLHDSYYDTLILARIVFRMTTHPIAKEKIIKFLNKN